LEKIDVVKNGVHLHKFEFREKDEKLLAQYKLHDKFIVAYIGTHGMAHKLDFILDCAKEIKNDTIHFLFVGAGAMKERLVRQAKKLRLQNVSLLDSVPKSEVVRYISISDVALINLRKKDTFTKVIPSKIFENAAMLKPILLGVAGEAKEIVNNYNAGLCFEPENKKEFLEKLSDIIENKLQYKKFQRGCHQLAHDFNRKKLALNMLEVISSTASLPQQNKKESLIPARLERYLWREGFEV